MLVQRILGITLRWLIMYLLDSAVVEGYCLENVALGKPAAQPNTGFNAPAAKAVDGNGDQSFSAASCTYSTSGLPYWQVDLQGEYTIMAVTITNRAEARVWRLYDFDIEIYTTNPLTDPGATFEKCLTFPGAFGDVTRTLFCDSMLQGRYVRIQKNVMGSDDALTLCEVAVHPYFYEPHVSCETQQKHPADFISHDGAYMRTSGFKEFSGSLMSCMVECFWLPVCDGFNFNGTGHGVGLCELIPVGIGKPVSTSGWTYYEAVCN